MGREPGDLQCRSFPVKIDDESEPLTANNAWQDAITDIILLGPGTIITVTRLICYRIDLNGN
ncbi:hypothetical protein EON65_00100 [archaeon]|nr:MAG: hypothetical protein EON65_00100 [archaeon]